MDRLRPAVLLVPVAMFGLACGGTSGTPGHEDAQTVDLSLDGTTGNPDLPVHGDLSGDRPDSPVPSDHSGTPPDPGECGTAVQGLFPIPALEGYHGPNAYSWDGSWAPPPGDFPISGLVDNEYGDGHLWEGNPTPILPPGAWDWEDEGDDFANWRVFKDTLGHFEMLFDHCDHHYGWRFVAKDPDLLDYQGPAMAFEGSHGTDILYLGAGSSVHSFEGYLDHGPDVLVFNQAWSLDFGTGPPSGGSSNDNDLVVAGCTTDGGAFDLHYDIKGITIHTGPGSDLAFARDMWAAAVDAGNGEGGDTSILDPTDGNDVVVYRGSIKDVRFFGGNGNDVAVWFADEMKEPTPFAGGNFFGGGGAGEALWGDQGTDRLVMAVPVDTAIVGKPATPPGSLLVMSTVNDYGDEIVWDVPMMHDPHAKYCISCGVGPQGRRTVIMEYVSDDGSIDTGYFFTTGIEELQIGVGPGAQLYRLDDVNGMVVPDSGLVPFDPPDMPWSLCEAH